MLKGAKLIIIILAVLFFGSLFLLIQVNSSKEALVKQYTEREASLRKQAEDMASQLSSAQSEKRRLEDRWQAVKKDIDGLTSERDDWKKRYETVLKEKEDLITKLQTMPKAIERTTEERAAPATTESYWADVLKSKAALELQINDLRSKLSEASIQVEEAKRAKAEVEAELAKLKQSSEDMESKIKYSTDLANNLSLELAKEKISKKDIEDRLVKLREENLSLHYKIKELATSKVTLEKGLQRLVADKDKLNKRLVETEQLVQSRIDEVLKIKKDIEARMSKAASSGGAESKAIELPPIVVRSGSGSTHPKPSTAIAGLAGKVVSVDEANNFVVIDLGEDAGVRVGNTFKIFRNNKQIASIEVIQTRKDISAADIKQKSQSIQTGDLVK